ncbi:MAG: tetratricopeptide repeat protein [Gammaproteobacteria bacterium]|nr:tetratricopeptide repeat protein [Gammaproteobacteria bacterium]
MRTTVWKVARAWIGIAAVLATFGAQASPGACDSGVSVLQAEHARIDDGGVAFLNNGAVTDALQELEERAFGVIANCRQHAGAYTLMGEIQISLGQVSLAVLYGRRAVALDANNWRAQQLLGSTLAMLGEAEAGLAHLARAVRLEPGNERLRLNYAGALLAAGRLNGARERCQSLTKSDDRQLAGLAWNLCGQVRLASSDKQGAREAFATARRLGVRATERLVDTRELRRYQQADWSASAGGN